MVIELIATACVFGIGLIRAQVKKAVTRFEQDFDSDQLVYKLQRNAIICPRCSSSFIVRTFEEQLNDKWECPTCHCSWFETHTHDIIKE